MVAEERLKQPGAVTEASKDRPLANPRRCRDGIQRGVFCPPFFQNPFRRFQDPLTVGGRVGALCALSGDRQFLGPGVLSGRAHFDAASMVPGSPPTCSSAPSWAASRTEASISTLRIETLSTLSPNGTPNRRQN